MRYPQIPDPDQRLIQLLLTRLERISADSYWAHRASGVRGSLIRVLEGFEKEQSPDRQALQNLCKTGFQILERAAGEKR